MSQILISQNNTFQLHDNRTLGYAQYGDPGNFPVLFFHGIPGSRLQRPLDLDFLSELSLCLYCLERPGIGLSTPKHDRNILDWIEDVYQFCEWKGFPGIALVGISGGSPYALAFASRQKDLVKSLTIISGMAPLSERPNFKRLPFRTRLLFTLASSYPKASAAFLSLLLRAINNRVDLLFSLLLTHLPASDRKMLTNPMIREFFTKDILQAFHNGSAQVIQEIRQLLAPWSCTLEEISQPVHIWHGYDDTIMPLPLARELIKRIPNSKPHLLPGKGHFFALEEAHSIFEKIQQDIV